MKGRLTIVIAQYGLDRKITEAECISALSTDESIQYKFIDFEAGNNKLSELYNLSYDNLALYQQRKFIEIVKPVLDENPDALIVYFGLTPIPIAFHFGFLVGNIHPYVIYQYHHKLHKWLKEAEKPSAEYEFSILPLGLPSEIQKGKGDVSIRIATSFNIDKQATYEVAANPANEFDIALQTPNVDALYNQDCIERVVSAFQDVLDCYANKLSDRDKIQLFIAASSGLPFALGTLINTNIYPFIQTYQFSRDESPKYKEAILVTKEVDSRVILSEDDRNVAQKIRAAWQNQLDNNIKPFIKIIAGKKSENWLQMICATDTEYKKVSKQLKHPWSTVTDINKTSLKSD